MAFYETVFVARQDLSAAQVEALAANLTEIITQGKGVIAKTEFCGLRSLAYSIKKNRKGHYVMFGVDASPEAMTELQRQFRLSEDVIRSMTIQVSNIDKVPSIMMKSEKPEYKRKSGDE